MAVDSIVMRAGDRAMCSDAYRPPESGHDRRAVRCLRIIHCLYSRGSTSLADLARLTAASGDLIRHDVSLMNRGGLKIMVGEYSECAIGQLLPGFALRLTEQEAAMVWLRLWNCSVGSAFPDNSVPLTVVTDAIALLEAGLRKYHAEGESLARQPTKMLKQRHGEGVEGFASFASPNLSGEAKRIWRRLRILDLVESGNARHREQLVAVLSESDRTVGNDLAAIRRAGLGIAYHRGERTYWVDSLHTFLHNKLLLSGKSACARALFTLFDTERNESTSHSLNRIAFQKIINSLRLIFRGRESVLGASASRPTLTDRQHGQPSGRGS